MDPTAFVAQLRDHYVAQFEAFADEQRQSCARGASEVKLRLSDESAVYRHLYCADFVRNDGQSEVVEFLPDRVLAFEPITGLLGTANLIIEHLRWDDVLIYHDLAPIPLDQIGDWFQRWFDPDDERHEQGAATSDVVHSLLLEPNRLSIDLGTAPPEAFWDMLELLVGAGATAVRVGSSRAEAEAQSD